jgi:hypothetical protein
MSMYKVTRTTPSSVTLSEGTKAVRVMGESFARGYGSPDFVIEVSSIKQWDTPAGEVPISDLERGEIVRFLLAEFKKRNWDIVAE